MKTFDKIFLFPLLILLLFSCAQTKNASTSTTPDQPETTVSESDKKDPKVVAPVVVDKKPNPPSESGTATAAAEELSMISEINSIRTNPKGYIPYIQEYLKYYERESFPDLAGEKKAAKNLIAELNNMSPVQQVTFDNKLYKVAKRHGQDLKSTGNIRNPHVNSKGQNTATRIKEGTGLAESGENFGGYHASPRYQLISLLVDSGVSGQGHRKNILDARWNKVACYSIGQVAEADGCWLQLFAKDGGDSSSTSTGNNNTPTISLSEATQLVGKATYMMAAERDMLNEINLLRSNPKGYVKHIETYKKMVKSGEIWTMVSEAEELAVADGLIKELNAMGPLTVLKPDEKLFKVAKKHGKYLKQKGSLDLNPNPHAGAGGKGADARIKAGANMSAGGENYAGVTLSVRNTVIGLLVDSGIPGYGHRKTLLDPMWEYGACHNFGSVKSSGGIDMPDNWLQNFGKK